MQKARGLCLSMLVSCSILVLGLHARGQITPPVTVPAGVTYVRPSYNWSQTPSGMLSGGSLSGVTLTPCPIGIDTTSGSGYQVYLSGGGNSEAVSVVSTPGDCTSGGSSGMIHFTPFNSYSSGYTIGSASSGIQETINIACGTGATTYLNTLCNVTIPANNYGGASANTWNIYGTIFLHSNLSVLSGYGVSLNCGGPAGATTDTLRGPCLQVGDLLSSNDYTNNTVQGISFRSPIANASNPAYEGVSITNTSRATNALSGVPNWNSTTAYTAGQTVSCGPAQGCSGTSDYLCLRGNQGDLPSSSPLFWEQVAVATITTSTANNFRAGDVVTIMFTDDSSYWGDAFVCGTAQGCTAPGGTTFQYLHPGVAIASQSTPGVVALSYDAILDNAVATHFIDIQYDPAYDYGKFNNFFDLWDDENCAIDHFNNNAVSLNASASWTGSFIFSAGNQGAGHQIAPVITLRDSNITANSSNGVTDYNSNGLYIENTVIQASGPWQVYSSNTTGNYQGAYLKNIYSESGTGQNPYWSVIGSVTSGTFATNEQVKQTTTGATGYLENAVTGSGPMLLGGLTGTPDNSHTWVGQTSGAVYTPTSLPAAKSPFAGLGVSGLIAGESSGAANFEIIGSSTTSGSFQSGEPIFALTSVNGSGVYQGNITYGASNALVGEKFTITGFTNGNNNLNNATVTASTTTSLTFSASTTSETHTATATLTASNYSYSYYIVANDCPSGATCPSLTPYTSRSSPMQVLNWLSTGNDLIPVTWPRVANATDVISYDVIRMASPNGLGTTYPYIGGCGGGAFGACGAANTNVVPQCPGLVCTFQDNGGHSTLSYTIPQGNYNGDLEFWPGSIVALNKSVIVDVETANIVGVGLTGNPIQVAGKCTEYGTASPGGYTACLASLSQQDVTNQSATILTDGGVAGGGMTLSKGRLNFSSTAAAVLGPHHIITLVDSQPALTQATWGYRPSASANDTWIGTDGSTSGFFPYNAPLAFGSPVQISSYIGAVGNPSTDTPLELLTSSTKTFNVPIRTPGASITLSRASISANTCSVQTSTMSGLAATSVVKWSFASTPIGITGYGTGALQISTFATTSVANVVVCNITGTAITPGPMTLNLRAEL